MMTQAPAPTQTPPSRETTAYEELLKYGVIILAVVALPGMLLAGILYRLFRWLRLSPWWWLPLVALGLLYGYVVYTFEHPIRAAAIYVLTIESQVASLHLDWLALWKAAYPVWLDTLFLAPLVGAVASITGKKSVARQLRDQVREGGEARRRASERARKQINKGSVPDALAGNIVLGVPIEEEGER